MMTSYRSDSAVMTLTPQLADNARSRLGLSYLVRLRLPALARLEIQDLSHVLAREDVVTAPDALLKTQRHQELSKLIEANVLIGGAGQDTPERPIGTRHPFT